MLVENMSSKWLCLGCERFINICFSNFQHHDTTVISTKKKIEAAALRRRARRGGKKTTPSRGSYVLFYLLSCIISVSESESYK